MFKKRKLSETTKKGQDLSYDEWPQILKAMNEEEQDSYEKYLELRPNPEHQYTKEEFTRKLRKKTRDSIQDPGSDLDDHSDADEYSDDAPPPIERTALINSLSDSQWEIILGAEEKGEDPFQAYTILKPNLEQQYTEEEFYENLMLQKANKLIRNEVLNPEEDLEQESQSPSP